MGTVVGYGFNWLPFYLRLDENGWRWLLAGGFLLLAILSWRMAVPGRGRNAALLLVGMALLLAIYNLSPLVTEPMIRWGRTLPGLVWPRVIGKTASALKVFT